MREIKFRAWFAKRGEMHPVDSLELSSDGFSNVLTKVCEGGGWYENVEAHTRRKTLNKVTGQQVPRVVLMQYTGLKDKNGKEIYEGDVLKGYDHMTFTDGRPHRSYRFFLGEVKFGEYNQDGSGDEYGPALCLGFYLNTKKIINSITDENERVDGFEETVTLLEFDELEVIGNIYKNPELIGGKVNEIT